VGYGVNNWLEGNVLEMTGGMRSDTVDGQLVGQFANSSGEFTDTQGHGKSALPPIIRRG
jgi:hypothetical protein